jgi:hypothetical protein
LNLPILSGQERFRTMKLSRRDWIRTVGTVAGISLFTGVAVGEESPEPAPIPKNIAQVPTNDPLLSKVEQAISVTTRRKLEVGVHSPWQVVHGVLALRQDMMMVKPDGTEISGIDWMASGALWKGDTIFKVTQYGGQGHPFSAKWDFEGHPTQFLGYMCEARMPLDFEFQAGPKKITVRDIINDAKMQIKEGPEVTWTLWALSHYLDTNAEWINARNEQWSIERMLRIEHQNSVLNSACGGTHGLYALAYARNKHVVNGNRMTSTWLLADNKIKRYITEAERLQSPDGSFSAAYFRGPEQAREFTKRLPANGHVLEFLMRSVPDEDLNKTWIRRGVESVATDLIDNRRTPCDCGPLFHALHALKLYKQRAAGGDYCERPMIQVVKDAAKATTEAPQPPKENETVTAAPNAGTRN